MYLDSLAPGSVNLTLANVWDVHCLVPGTVHRVQVFRRYAPKPAAVLVTVLGLGTQG